MPAPTHVELKFKDDFKSPTLELLNGPYHRLFGRNKENDQTFIATADEYDLHLLAQGKFDIVRRFTPAPEEAKKPEPDKAGTATTGQGTAQSDQSAKSGTDQSTK